MSVEVEMQSIFDKHGAVTPSLVVEFAKDETTELHKRFEWDDTAAAEQYRLNQARRVIRVTKIVYEGERQTLFHVPKIKWEEQGDDKSGKYIPAGMVVKAQKDYQRCRDEILSKIMAMQSSLGELERYAVKDGIDDAGQIKIAMMSMAAAIEALRSLH